MIEWPIKYNPAFLTEEELVGSFVVRHADLDLVLRVVRENTSGSNQHVLIIGPRGSGKTTLVLRVAAEVRRDEELGQRWYPLVMAEESYQVFTPGEFWLDVIFHLGQQTDDERWKRTHDDLRQEMDEDRLRERALGQLLDFADAQGKRILLIVENFNMLVGDQISPDDAWVLRHTLQNEPRIMLLATATRRFEEVENADKAMFELLTPHDLEPLNESECRAVWTSVTGDEPQDNRIRPIQILTGGNPRLLTIISSFGAGLSFQDLMQNLLKLVDEHTEYFKSQLDHLAAVERKVYLCLAELWSPSTAREVAEAARLDVNRASSLLNRLVQRGAVAVTAERPRRKLYQVAERMYNIYYLMRRRGAPSTRVKAVVNFMTHFYGPEELVRVTRHIADEATVLEPALRQDHYLAYESIMRSADHGLRARLLEETPPDFLEASDVPSSLQGVTLLQQAHRLSRDPERLNEAESMYRKAVELEPKYAWAWAHLGWLLDDKLERYDEAEAAYRKAVELDPEHALAWASLGWLLHDELERYDEAVTAYRRATELEPEVAWRWGKLAELLAFEGRRPGESLKSAKRYLEHNEWIAKNVDSATRLFTALAGIGFGSEALKIVSESPSAQLLEPLVVGLRLHLGEDVKAPAEVMEVASDVVRLIEQMRDDARPGEEAPAGRTEKPDNVERKRGRPRASE